MIVKAKSAHFIYLPKTINDLGETESAEWLNLANVIRAYQVIGNRLFIEFVNEKDCLYQGVQAEVIQQELERICQEQIDQEEQEQTD